MNRLKELREKSGLRLRELERYLDIDNSALCLIENGKRPLREIHVLKITNFFDVTSDYLLGYSDEGIGMYFEDEHAFVSEIEYHLLKSQHHVSEMVVTKPAGFGMSINSQVQEIRTYSCIYSIHRSVDVTQSDAGISTSTKEKIISELNRLDSRELEKVLRFINDYIK